MSWKCLDILASPGLLLGFVDVAGICDYRIHRHSWLEFVLNRGHECVFDEVFLAIGKTSWP